MSLPEAARTTDAGAFRLQPGASGGLAAHGPLNFASARHAYELILVDHTPSDALLDRVLSPTIFSTPTNRRIFRGMVRAADSESWQRIFQLMTENSRWDLPDLEVAEYVARSYDFIMDLLSRMDRAEPFRMDPSGDEALRLAKRVRKKVLRDAPITPRRSRRRG